MYEYDRFLVAELQEEATVAHAERGAGATGDPQRHRRARRLVPPFLPASPRQTHYLETSSISRSPIRSTTVTLAVHRVPAADHALPLRSADGLHEIVLMPWDCHGQRRVIATAAEDVLLDVVRAIGWNPRPSFATPTSSRHVETWRVCVMTRPRRRTMARLASVALGGSYGGRARSVARHACPGGWIFQSGRPSSQSRN
jgi:hypothetical protein